MSDQEGALGGSGANDDELSLPKATVNKYVAELLGPSMSASKETLQLILDCCIEFIHLVSSESNEVCEKESRKTISPDHVLTALKALGFEKYIPELEEVLKDHKQIVKSDRDRKAAKMQDNDMTEEELVAMQQSLFAQSVARLNNGEPAPGPP
ncbi:negative cofactor 2 transcription regulator complex subunit ncb2 [Serendipita sp. 411]|nr:negative cofactor 2 transcription regulator complex subunit ncb2 [Serendipita sp. 397]KAG8813385.1 negative cofactor 2 transcription regulator complex subunit ncb2 [Serendipita sp. 401]KAG8831204.1 negative cofactor 2 transcription regulator complex subunit ncb2 [Serendipita sp. 400]KAG8841010.1 negative cofactor 2 transcription regulator complex subunit ncb2 [Serendipita sp. 405]KAG8850799.1 negative cofactor 2 transcription regulator complex subunit ncb2 [Serendipita sp. 411]KAG9044281.1 